MDPVAWRVREVVLEACLLAARCRAGRITDDRTLASLECLRVDLLALAAQTSDLEVAADARDVAREIAEAFEAMERHVERRSA
ncbi:MAG TPA: hypothetical protein VML96_12080 [Egibacteraceae bacterium]|nr:hypothetical protein [Egibacteraceae bacterium]